MAGAGLKPVHTDASVLPPRDARPNERSKLRDSLTEVEPSVRAGLLCEKETYGPAPHFRECEQNIKMRHSAQTSRCAIIFGTDVALCDYHTQKYD